MGQTCFNTLECYCELPLMKLLLGEWGTISGRLDVEKLIPTPDPLSALPVSASDEAAWEIKYGAAMKSSDEHEVLKRKALNWKTAADFHKAADRLEHNRSVYGTYCVKEWRYRNWGTDDRPYRSRRFKLSKPSAGKPHIWEFDTYQLPPFLVIRKLSEYLPQIPMHLYAYSCAMEAWCHSSFIAGFKVKKRRLPVPARMKSWLNTGEEAASDAETATVNSRT